MAPEIALGWIVSIGVEGVHIVLRGGDDQHIVEFAVAHHVLAQIERLGVDITVTGRLKTLPKDEEPTFEGVSVVSFD